MSYIYQYYRCYRADRNERNHLLKAIEILTCCVLKFCHGCGTRMVIRNQRYECPKCGNSTPIVLNQIKREIRPTLNHVDVIEQSSSRTKKVSQHCPQCPNNQAFRWYSYSSGEHAGVKQDRIVEHFQCTQCRYIWGESR